MLKGGSLVYLEAAANGALTSSSLSCLSAAKQLSQPISVYISTAAAEKSKATQLLHTLSSTASSAYVVSCKSTSASHVYPESEGKLLASIMTKCGFNAFLAPHSTVGRVIAPWLAAQLGASPLTDIIGIKNENEFVKPVYAGNALATFKFKDNNKPKIMTIRPTAFAPLIALSSESANKDLITKSENEIEESQQVKFISQELTKSDRPELGNAKVVVTGGRALKSSDQFKRILSPLADTLGAALGATRAAVDSGLVPNDLQIGQTGKIVAPSLYFAIGVSGAIQHLAGMKESKVIVAINKDPDAPIFAVADYGLVADLFTAVPELTKLLSK